MMYNSNLIGMTCVNTSQTVTIVPRLEYSTCLLDSIIEVLKRKQIEIKKLNQNFMELDDGDHTFVKTIDFERTIVFSLETLSQIQKIIHSISGITSIPKLLPLTIPVIRTLSAQLFTLLPSCSQNLSELSVHLGSIVLDSAIITHARFDFSQSNLESASLLNEVKLIVDSKISKQYPNVDFSKAGNN